MKRNFDQLMNQVKTLHLRLMGMTPLDKSDLPLNDIFAGVYVFFEKGRALYVGRGKNVRNRILQQSRLSVHDAPFAHRLARKATGRKATYKVEGGRKWLKNDAQFCAAVQNAKNRIGRMEVCYVQVENPTTQALLEIYTSTVLGTPYNEFKTT